VRTELDEKNGVNNLLFFVLFLRKERREQGSIAGPSEGMLLRVFFTSSVCKLLKKTRI